TSDFLLIARLERLDLPVGQQALDFAIRQLAALDTGRGADALDRGNPPKCRQPIRCQRAKCTPRTLEFVYPGDQAQDVGGDLEGVCADHETNSTPIYTQL